ncbi:MAG: SMI1/KNR4 family protein [candidate division WOR-3 bacterium]
MFFDASDDDWDRIEGRLGVRIPAALRRFHRSPKRYEYFTPLSPSEIGDLQEVYPAVPQRVLPVFIMKNGDHLGLFYPRQGGDPFLVWYDHEAGAIKALTSDLDWAIANPDRFLPDSPINRQGIKAVNDSAWRSLIIDVDRAGIAELELLKPMSLHYRVLESNCEDHFRKLFKRFGSIDPRAKAIRELFKAPEDLHDRKRWYALSDSLARLEYWRDAIQALDNCHTILFIHPHYGEGTKKGKASWRNVAWILGKLLAIAMVHGDTFDRVFVKHQLAIAEEWAKRECGYGSGSF